MLRMTIVLGSSGDHTHQMRHADGVLFSTYDCQMFRDLSYFFDRRLACPGLAAN